MQHSSVAATSRSDHRRARVLTPIEWAILALVGLAFAAAMINSTATSRPADMRTITLRVSQGDTMWELASAHRVDGLSTAQTVALIAEINGLSEGQLFAGETIVVPAFNIAPSSLAMR